MTHKWLGHIQDWSLFLAFRTPPWAALRGTLQGKVLMVLEWSPTHGKPFFFIVKIYVPTSPPPPTTATTSPSPQLSPTTPPSPRPICQRNLHAGWDEEGEVGHLDISAPSHHLSQVNGKIVFFIDAFPKISPNAGRVGSQARDLYAVVDPRMKKRRPSSQEPGSRGARTRSVDPASLYRYI